MAQILLFTFIAIMSVSFIVGILSQYEADFNNTDMFTGEHLTRDSKKSIYRKLPLIICYISLVCVIITFICI